MYPAAVDAGGEADTVREKSWDPAPADQAPVSAPNVSYGPSLLEVVVIVVLFAVMAVSGASFVHVARSDSHDRRAVEYLEHRYGITGPPGWRPRGSVDGVRLTFEDGRTRTCDATVRWAAAGSTLACVPSAPVVGR